MEPITREQFQNALIELNEMEKEIDGYRDALDDMASWIAADETTRTKDRDAIEQAHDHLVRAVDALNDAMIAVDKLSQRANIKVIR